MIGPAWIFKISNLACSFGRSISRKNHSFNKSRNPTIPMGHILLPATGKQKLTDFSVQPSGPQQGRIQGVRSVGSHDHFNSVQSVKSIHLIQQLTGNRTLVLNNPRSPQSHLFSCLSYSWPRWKALKLKKKDSCKALSSLNIPSQAMKGWKHSENALPREKDIEQSWAQTWNTWLKQWGKENIARTKGANGCLTHLDCSAPRPRHSN